jgi:transposase
LLQKEKHHKKRFIDLADATKAIDELKEEKRQLEIGKDHLWKKFLKLKFEYDELQAKANKDIT